jgi:hypothetical protein
MYDLAPATMATLADTSGTDIYTWCTSIIGTYQLQYLEDPDALKDDFGVTGWVPSSWPDSYQWPAPDVLDTDYHIYSYYRTSWVDPISTVVQKRWKRAQFVLVGDNLDYEFLIRVFKDYKPLNPSKQFYMQAGVVNSTATWDLSLWDIDAWDTAQGRFDDIEDGSAVGLARSVQLMFEGPVDDVQWGVNQITFRYIPKRIR